VDQGIPGWIVGIILAFLAGLFIFVVGAYKLLRTKTDRKKKIPRTSFAMRNAALHIKHGPQAGKSFMLNKLPVLIGRDPQSDICINDPHVFRQHAQIYSERNGYYLRNLGGGTFINGRSVKSNTVALNPGDVVRLGKSFLFVFG
jgi:pSer/pThr/pTyr-binding forkhead associated (FHA) protein